MLKGLFSLDKVEEITANFNSRQITADDNLLFHYAKSRGFYDWDFFMDFFLPHWKTDKKTGVRIESPPFHLDVRNALQKLSNTVLIVSRNHAKSTVSRADSVWDILYEIEPSTLLIMSGTLGRENIGKIRDEFEENYRIIRAFGNLVPSKSKKEANKEWTKSSLQFLNDTEIKTVTFGGAIRGRRPTKIKVDDPQESKDCQNPAICEKFYNWFLSDIYPMLDPTGRCVVIGTVVHEMCLVNKLKADGEEMGDRHVIQHEAIREIEFQVVEKGVEFVCEDGSVIVGKGRKHIVGGRPIRPQKRTLGALDKMYGIVKHNNFMQEYQNIPYTINTTPFYEPDILSRLRSKRTDFIQDKVFKGLYLFKSGFITKKIDNKKVKRKRKCACGVDTSKGIQGGDRSCISIRDIESKRLLAFYVGYAGSDKLIRIVDYLVTVRGYNILPKRLLIENNGVGYATVVEALKKPRGKRLLYAMEGYDQLEQTEASKRGFSTNAKTRPFLMSTLQTAVEGRELEDGTVIESIDDFDPRFMEEAKTMVYDEKGKPRALPPYHDDTQLGDALCLFGCEAPTVQFISKSG